MKGGCLCGAVRYELVGKATSVTYCHCAMCRRWHGHVGAYAAVDREDLKVAAGAPLRWYASSPGVKRGFCGECGSTLFFDEAGDPKVGFTAGTLDPTDQEKLRSKAHIFVKSKGAYYELVDDGLLRLEGGP